MSLLLKSFNFFPNAAALGLVFLVLCGGAFVVSSSSVKAVGSGDWRVGNIIEDNIFYNNGDMSANDIQSFLNSKMPACDTWGQQPHSSGGTRAQYGASHGVAAPYICVKDYYENPSTHANNLNGTIPPGSTSAAGIIKHAADTYGINPKVLIVLLQKEQGLIADDWPWPIQYRSAMGYGCPDTAPCDAEYYGFYNQTMNAARQFRLYANSPDSYRYKPYQNNYIQYNPNAGCGGTNVYIQNKATAGLYNYTPYQPNQSALNAGYGSGDGCGAYGNRNFWLYFNDWFGSSSLNCTYPSGTNGSQVLRLFQPSTNSYLLTTDPGEVCLATGYYGFQYDGVLTYRITGASPVYRLVKNGNYLYTTSETERVTATQNYGYTLNGVAFTANINATPNASLPVYRLRHHLSGGYHYTVSTAERDMMTQNGYINEGTVFYTDNQDGIAMNNAYRLSSANNGYIYTISSNERQIALESYGFRDEGVAFKVRAGFSGDNLPVYRMSRPGTYLYTTSFSERKAALQLGYRGEGIAFYSYPLNNLQAELQVYRLRGQRGVYFYTTSLSERNSAIQNYGYQDEGVGFRAQ